jgi:hypothetical protein
MDWPAILADSFRLAIPALLVVATAALVLRHQAAKQLRADRAEMRVRSFSTIMPLRMAAHERAMLFLTRIRLEAIVPRLDPANCTAATLRQRILEDIRSEFDHNAVQALYVAEKPWRLLMSARDEVVALVLTAAEELPASASGLDLAAKIATSATENPPQFGFEAEQALRAEVLRLMA